MECLTRGRCARLSLVAILTLVVIGWVLTRWSSSILLKTAPLVASDSGFKPRVDASITAKFPGEKVQDVQRHENNTQDLISHVGSIESSQPPVDDNQPPLDNIQDVLPPSDNIQDVQPPLGNIQDVQPPLGNIQDVLPPLGNIQDVLPPSDNIQDVLPPLENIQDIIPQVDEVNATRDYPGEESGIQVDFAGNKASLSENEMNIDLQGQRENNNFDLQAHFGDSNFSSVDDVTRFVSGLYDFRSHPFPAFWVGGGGDLLTERVPLYNKAIGHIRAEILARRGFRPWREPDAALKVLWGSRDDFLEQLRNFSHVRTVALEWHNKGDQSGGDKEKWSSRQDTANVVVQDYYPWVATEPLCSWIRTPAFTKARYDAVFNRTCTGDLDMARIPTSIEPVYFRGKPINPNHYWPHDGLAYPEYFYTTLPDQVLYLHILQDAIITDPGDVISGDLKLVPYSCSHDRDPVRPPGYAGRPVYTEVFVITQFWGASFFHKHLEVFPRFAPYLAFLRAHQEVLVHVVEAGGRTSAVLQLLGVSPERFVTGVTRAKTVYMPQGTACGFPQIQEIQILSALFNDYIQRSVAAEGGWVAGPPFHHDGDVGGGSLPGPPSDGGGGSLPGLPGDGGGGGSRRSLVVIHRSGMRRLSEVADTERALQTLAEEYNLQFVLFHDQQLPTLKDTMLIFHQAALVFAPHGAGLANILYCQPGSYVIEAVCNPPHVNLCYQWTAHALGMRYHAIPSREGCEDHITVDTTIVKFVVRSYLDQIRDEGKQSPS